MFSFGINTKKTVHYSLYLKAESNCKRATFLTAENYIFVPRFFHLEAVKSLGFLLHFWALKKKKKNYEETRTKSGNCELLSLDWVDHYFILLFSHMYSHHSSDDIARFHSTYDRLFPPTATNAFWVVVVPFTFALIFVRHTVFVKVVNE